MSMTTSAGGRFASAPRMSNIFGKPGATNGVPSPGRRDLLRELEYSQVASDCRDRLHSNANDPITS